MYFPYLRGKQFELIAVRELAGGFSASNTTPIIEPVNSSTVALQRAIVTLIEAESNHIIILNPQYGAFSEDPTELFKFYTENLEANDLSIPGILLTSTSTRAEVTSWLEKWKSEKPIALLHKGYTDHQYVTQKLSNSTNTVEYHIFFDPTAGRIYRNSFQGGTKVYVQDGFQAKRRNADYPEFPLNSNFSELLATYPDDGWDAFGDFQIVGDQFSEGGGPAYAVAIHITYVDEEDGGMVKCFHFLSNRKDNAEDVAGKFGEALEKLKSAAAEPSNQIRKTESLEKLITLQHFPGLGKVKQLSIMHHIELMMHHDNP